MHIQKVQKRNGRVVDFDHTRIERAISAAMKSVGELDPSCVRAVAIDVCKELEERYGGATPQVEQIQDVVEETLISLGYAAAAKSYILYRDRRTMARNDADVAVKVADTIHEYLDQSDWRVRANANQGYSLGGMILNTAGKVTANYWLSHIYPPAIADAHRNGDIHIHDLDMLSGYCAGWSLCALLEQGFNGVSDKIESGPPKHLSSAVAQMINFLGTLQNEWAGAQAFSSFDTYLAPFVKKYEMELEKEIESCEIRFSSDEDRDAYLQKKTYRYVRQEMQSFVFNLNIPSRWGTQTPFTNITMDLAPPEDLKDARLLLGGEPFPYRFGELQKEMDMINRAFIEVMTEGDAKGRAFTFPIPTYNITKEFDWENPAYIPLFEMTAKYGTPYFQNFVNSDLRPGDVRSMCCRLQLDLKELKKRGGGLFGSSEMTGSIGVVTLNMARIGYQCHGSRDQFFHRVFELMELAKASLEMKRKEVEKWMERGLFPFTKRYLGHLHNHFSTIGLNGLNEAIRNMTSDKEYIATPWGRQFAMDVLDGMRAMLKVFQAETGHLYNLEATPAEGAMYRFAKEDQKRFPEILHAGPASAPFYTNSSQLPVGYTDDVFEALTLQDSLQTKYTGGTVLHCYMSERISNAAVCRDVVRKILTNFRLPYITITPTFSICPKHGYLAGEYDFCPKCDDALGIIEASRFDIHMRAQYTLEQSSVG